MNLIIKNSRRSKRYNIFSSNINLKKDTFFKFEEAIDLLKKNNSEKSSLIKMSVLVELEKVKKKTKKKILKPF